MPEKPWGHQDEIIFLPVGAMIRAVDAAGGSGASNSQAAGPGPGYKAEI